jgi:hypothetical protein
LSGVKSHVARAAIAFGATLAVLLAAPSCALFTDLDGSKYSTPDAGTDGACREAGCGQKLCLSTEDCVAGQVCCLTASFTAPPTLACQSTCPAPLGIQLCQGESDPCLNGQSCMENQQCTLEGIGPVTLAACALIPTCGP